MCEYICVECTPYFGFTIGKKYKAHHELQFDDVWLVWNYKNDSWVFTESDTFTGFHRYFKSIRDIRKEKLLKINGQSIL